MSRTDIYDNPLVERYASAEMCRIFSPDFKFRTWRKLWLALAEAQKDLGLPITDDQIREMREHLEDIDYQFVRQKEKELRHDVMAHVHGFAEVCPAAAPIIHLGATSAFVGDNTDLIQLRAGMRCISAKLAAVMKALAAFAREYRDLPVLAFTHFQPAQLTTLGKRACLWLQDLEMDLVEVDRFIETLPLRGVKGTTGTQASYLALFEGDHEKVEKLDRAVCSAFGFEHSFAVTGQTYPRKIDDRACALLSGIAQSAAKFANDVRLLQHRREVMEPFGKKQIGSSAMAYKRNPMRSERIGSLARFVMAQAQTTAYTASTQWFERTLDDSANKRLAVAQAFLAADAILDIFANIAAGLEVNHRVIARAVEAELPFMMTENILMTCVKQGGNRQDLHERIRVHSLAAAAQLNDEGGSNTLLDRIAGDPVFGITRDALESLRTPADYVGRSPVQVTQYLARIDGLLARHETAAPDELQV